MGKDFSVAVVGLGYIGLPTAAILASRDVRVHGVDVNPATVAAVNAGEVPFVEPDLADYVKQAVSEGTLTASTEVEVADVYIVAVPTPFLDDQAPDLSYIEAAAKAIATKMQRDGLVILESTSPPGATRQMAEWIVDERPDLRAQDGGFRFHVAHCPERVLPGRVMVELVENDRIVGGLTAEAAKRARTVYEVFCQGNIHLTDAKTAELAKLVENAFRDVNIAFANELSVVADDLGVDVWELISLANHHPRVNILQPGPGVGGHCIAVDPWFIVAAARESTPLIRTARQVNDGKPKWVLDKVLEAVREVDRPTIAALGLSFKPDIDDLRESPARKIVADLADSLPEARILVVEPHIQELPSELHDRENVRLTSLSDATANADCVALLVDHAAFRGQQELAKGATIIDTRGAWRR